MPLGGKGTRTAGFWRSGTREASVDIDNAWDGCEQPKDAMDICRRADVIDERRCPTYTIAPKDVQL